MIEFVTGIVALGFAAAWWAERRRHKAELADITPQADGWEERYNRLVGVANEGGIRYSKEAAKLNKQLSAARNETGLLRKSRDEVCERLRLEGNRYMALIGRLNVAMQDPQPEDAASAQEGGE